MRNNQRRLGTGQTGGAPQTPSPAPAQANLAYVVPTEFVELPSRGLFYPEGHPLHKQETVEVKFMTAKDEDILASETLIKKGLIIDRLLENILVLDIDPVSLLVGDRNAIMIATRISGYGPGYTVNVTCRQCDTRDKYDFDLQKSSLSENCFDQSFLDSNGITFNEQLGIFEVILPATVVKVGLQMLRGEHERLDEDVSRDSIVTSTLSRFIVSVGDDSEDSEFIAQFIDMMPAADSRFLRKLYPQLVPNIGLEQEYRCSSCDHTENMEVPLTAEFFWPR